MVVRTTRPPRWRASTSSACCTVMSMVELLRIQGGGGPAGGLRIEVGAGQVVGRGLLVQPDVMQAPGVEDARRKMRAVVARAALLVGVPAAHADDDEQRQAQVEQDVAQRVAGLEQ